MSTEGGRQAGIQLSMLPPPSTMEQSLVWAPAAAVSGVGSSTSRRKHRRQGQRSPAALPPALHSSVVKQCGP